ncbi:MAG: hypothetical protein COA58_03615 [Bacteroidetes bacterium]|nr:MAG: hypothetical protein COA58_03615 [Bacteroidota bacterium]
MENTYIAFAIVFSLFLVVFFKKDKTTLDWYIAFYLGLSAFGEFYSLMGRDDWNILPNTIVGFAINQIVQMYVVSNLVRRDTNLMQRIPNSFILLVSLFGLLCLTPLSSERFIDADMAPTIRSWFTYHQYLDFTSIASLIILVNMFYWLYKILKDSTKTSEEVTRRYIVILGFLIFYGGTIFILAFGRLLLEDYSIWMKLMSSVYRPIYLFSYLIITIAVRWRLTPS